MRFEVGKDYVFTRIQFNVTNEAGKWSSTYIPWLHELKDIEIIVLTCTEHHKVAWDQDPNVEKNCDGFVFVQKDDPTAKWANQYPDASYGQLDDSNDALVRRHFETAELLKVDANGTVVKDADGKAIVIDQAKWNVFDDMFWKPFERATRRLNALKRAINGSESKLLEPEHLQQLEEFRDMYTKKIEEASGQKVTYVPISPNHSDYLVAHME